MTSESPRRHLQIVLITIVTYGLVRTKGRCGECQWDAANERPASYRVHSCHRMGTTTHPRHLGTQTRDAEQTLLYRIPVLPSIDGNTVDGHVEQAEFANNALHFQASLRFLNGKFRGLISAIKGE